MLIQNVLRRFAQMTGTACALCLVFASAQAIDLRKDLSEAQFKASGLTKLEDAELDELQRLINEKPAAAAVQAATKPVAVESSPNWHAPTADSERTIVESEVTESFKGLFGATKITLANGQIWQQTDRMTFNRGLRDKKVRIKPGLLGGWRLQFLDNNLSFAVKRVQ